jgi:hypothetical protein
MMEMGQMTERLLARLEAERHSDREDFKRMMAKMNADQEKI